MKQGTWPKKTGEAVKHAIEHIVFAVVRRGGPADDPDARELRDRVLRQHGVWAPPGDVNHYDDLDDWRRR
jgi:hypothetical protein